MTLPTPSLDDRRFQDIVDEAKRLIPRYCPEWTDHNLSDPGIALLELFAWMTDMTLYRLNQVPDRLYVKFLELLGIELYSAAPARAEVLFWLSGPQQEPVRVPAETQIGTVRTERDESLVFTTDEERLIVRPELMACVTSTVQGRYENNWDNLRLDGYHVTCFPTVQPGDAVLFGFEQGLAGNILRLEVTASVHSAGVDPTNPPWMWEATCGEQWVSCRILQDDTLAFNRSGALTMIVPPRHDALTLGATRAFWVRCRMLAPALNQPPFQDSPRLENLKATSLGAVAPAHHGQPTAAESLGRSGGTPGQRFVVRRSPVLPRREGETVRVVTSRGAEEWEEVHDFSGSGPDDRHFTWDGATGEIRFGPSVRYPDGTLIQHGAVPPLDGEVVAARYRYGGGVRGNVGARALTVLKSSIPFIGRVENLDSARGGVDPETVANAKARGPMSLRTGQRAVTVGDYERLTLEAAPAVARARCLPPAPDGGPLRVLIVPRLEVSPDRLALDDLVLPPELIQTVSDYLDERRMLTTAVEIRTPSYQGVTVVATVAGAPGSQADVVRDRALGALYRYVNPLSGGAEAAGWPFGTDLHIGEVFAVLSSVEGVIAVEEVRLYLADLRRGERREGRQRIQLPADALFASYQHQVQVR